MRILFLTDEHPWPARSGYQLRMAQVLQGLTEVGDVDLAVAVGTRRGVDPRPVDSAIARSTELPFRRVTGGRGGVALRWLLSLEPRVLLRADWEGAAARLRKWRQDDYDLVWYSHAPIHHALGHLVDAPAIVDLDDLHGVLLKHRHARRAPLDAPRQRVTATPAIARLTRLTDRVDQWRWHRIDLRAAGSVAAVVVCSDLDRGRLGAPNAAVVPNGYPRPAAVPPVPQDGPPTLLMVGKLGYEPNLDGAYAFVEQVLPRIRAALPDARLRLVGGYPRSADVAWLAGQPGVTVVGEVPDVAPELARASAVVVPLRYGGGTRIKILEAFAYCRPVVSTTVGVEGIDAVPGEHLLVADRPDDFAAACVRLLCDRVLGRRLVGAAHQLYDERYATDRVRPLVAELAREVAGRASVAGASRSVSSGAGTGVAGVGPAAEARPW